MTDIPFTPLDHAHEAMTRGDDAERLAYYRVFCDTLFTLWLNKPAVGDQIEPRLLETGEGQFLLAFDQEDWLAEATNEAVETAQLPGRAIISLLSGSDVGLAINVGSGRSDFLMPADVLAWIGQTIASETGQDLMNRPVGFMRPDGLPQGFAEGLAARISGFATHAMLTRAHYQNGEAALFLAVFGAKAEAVPALREGIREFVTLSDAEALDLVFLSEDDPLREKIAATALTLAAPEPVARPSRSAPGMDPDKPPKLH